MLLLLAVVPGPGPTGASGGDPGPVDPGLKVVLWDAPGSVNDLWGIGVAENSIAAQVLLDRGAHVWMAHEDLVETLDALEAGDVMVLAGGGPPHPAYTQAELDALEAFVHRGGGLLVLGEHDGFLGTLVRQNPVLDRFGMAFENASATGSQHEPFEERWLVVDAPAWGVRDAVLPRPAPIAVSSPDQVLVRTELEDGSPGDVVVAGTEHGEGRVVAVGDVEWLWNGDPGYIGIERRNTTALLVAVVEHLAGGSLPTEDLVEPRTELQTGDAVTVEVDLAAGARVEATGHGVTATRLEAEPGTARWHVEIHRDGALVLEARDGTAWDRDVVQLLAAPSTPADTATGTTPGTALLVTDGHARSPSRGPGGILPLATTLRDAGYQLTTGTLAQADLAPPTIAVLASPLEQPPGLAAWVQDHPEVRWVVSLEGWQSVEDCPTLICAQMREQGITDPVGPADPVLEALGVADVAGMPWQTGSPHQVPASTWAGAPGPPVHRAAGLTPEGTDHQRAWVLDRTAWLETTATTMDPKVPGYQLGEDLRAPRLALWDEQGFVLGDTSVLTTAGAARPVLDTLQAWASLPRPTTDVPGQVAAGDVLPGTLDVQGAPAVGHTLVLPDGVSVLEAPGASLEPGPPARLVWDASPAAFLLGTPALDGWLELVHQAELANGEQVAGTAWVRLAAPRAELVLDGPATVRSGSTYPATVHLVNTGDAPATESRAWINTTLLEPPVPRLQAGPAGGTGQPAHELRGEAEGWSTHWSLGELGSREEANATMRALGQPVPGEAPVGTEVRLVGEHGAVHEAGAVVAHRSLLPVG